MINIKFLEVIIFFYSTLLFFVTISGFIKEEQGSLLDYIEPLEATLGDIRRPLFLITLIHIVYFIMVGVYFNNFIMTLLASGMVIFTLFNTYITFEYIGNGNFKELIASKFYYKISRLIDFVFYSIIVMSFVSILF